MCITGLRRWIRLAAVGLLLALACLLVVVPGKHSDAADPVLAQKTFVPLLRSDGVPGEALPPPVPSAPAGTDFLLNEVRFIAVPGKPLFVELKNVGAATASPSGLAIGAGSAIYILPAGIPGATPGGLVVLLLDGGGATTGTTFHLPITALPGSSAGALRLLNGAAELDHVTWGDGALASGGGITDPLPGSVAARVPAGGTPWALLGPSQATPGTANPAAAVSAFATPDGSVFEGSSARLSWYNVPGATSYRVEVAAIASFSALLANKTVSASRPGALTPEQTSVGPLGPGLYYWRVTAIYPAGVTAVSDAQRVGLRAGSSATLLGGADEVGAAAATLEKRLPVPQLNQRKDTAMLQIENPSENGPLAWDKADADAPTRPYCVYAAVAMLNRYFGGDWTVDYAHYVTLKDQAPGPELDLEERGATIYEERTAIYEALGVDPGEPKVIASIADLQQFYATVKSEIDAGRPLAAMWPGHALLVIGYADEDEFGNFSIVVQDGNGPAFARSEFPESSLIWLAYLTIPAGAQRAEQGKVIQDSDGDGVVDFDETDRFRTSSGAKDSDHDKLEDKQDIRAGVWDERHGYARGGPGRDFDGDHIPMERDADGDDGGCFDGMEDANKDGKFDDDSELDNFEPGDDPCVGGTSVLVLESFQTYEDGGTHHSFQRLVTMISLEAQPDGSFEGTSSSTYFLEAQSTYTNSSCTFSSIPRVTVTWGATLTGSVLQGALNFTAEPTNGPTMTMTVIGCFAPETYETETVPFVGWGNIVFTNGQYHFREDYPLAPDETGEFYTEINLRQPAS